MGVQGLLPQLKEIQENVSLESFRGKTVAIDSYAWLHKGVMSCSWELARDQYTTRYVDYFRRKVKMLQHFGVKPYFVFDGDNFASKGDTEVEREKNRQQKKEMALELLSKGDKKGAYKYITQSVDVTPQMAKSVIEYLKQAEIPFVVAPYEADPQMVYLEKLGLVDGIISEDSDLLVFGARCLLTKLNEVGECVCIRREDFKKCRAVPIGLLNDSQLRMVACLSGCDYTDGIPRIGIVTAFKLVKRMCTMEKCLMNVRLEGKLKVPETFELEYQKADLSFQFQRVFDPVTNEITTLSAIPEHLTDHEHLFECIGPLLQMDTHIQIAHGEIDPISKKPLLSREASLLEQTKDATPHPAKKTLSLPSTLPKKYTPRLIKRSLTIPTSLTTSRSIDAFFRSGGTPSAQRSTTVPSSPMPSTPQSETKLSPTSKRRRLFHSTESKTPLTNSKFFPKKSITTSLSQVESTLSKPEEEPKALSQPVSTALHQLNSSDFELSDPDDDDDDKEEDEKNECPPERETPTTTPPDGQSLGPDSPTHKTQGSSYPQCQVGPTPEKDWTEELDKAKTGSPLTAGDDSLDSIVESPTICRRIVGATVMECASSSTTVTSSSEENVKKGLFERFGFRSEMKFKVPSSTTDSTDVTQRRNRTGARKPVQDRVPLEPVGQRTNQLSPIGVSPSVKNGYNRPSMTAIRTKRGVTRNLTLDSFVYRG